MTFRWLSHLGTPVRPDEEEKWTLKGGSFLDSATGDFNHKAGYTASPTLILGRVRRNLLLQNEMTLLGYLTRPQW